MNSPEITGNNALTQDAQFNPYSGSISNFPEQDTIYLTAGFSAVKISPSSPPLSS